MRTWRSLRWMLAAASIIAAGGAARADYYTHPELRPGYRCSEIPAGIGDPNDPGGPGSLHCQKLIWDVPVVTGPVGVKVVAAPYAEDSIPRFPHGLTDRPPPLFVGTLNGQAEGFERESDCTNLTGDCHRLCSDPLDVPYWKELLDQNGSPITGTDGFGHFAVDANGNATTNPQTGPLVQLDCQRGSRSYYGPWQTGGTVNLADCLAEPDHSTNAVAGKCQGPVFDRLTPGQPVKFENTARLDDDVLNAGTPSDHRLEWNTGTEFYNDFASHHAVCNQPTDACADVNNPPSRDDMSDTNPNAKCYGYDTASEPGSPCDPEDADPRNNCTGAQKISMGGFRDATQVPGRLTVPLPGGRGVIGTEDVTWGCNHHVVTQLPPGSYGMTRLANYRLQTHGLINKTPDTIWGVGPNQEYGGAVGEMVIQYFAAPLKSSGLKPLDIDFNAIADAATTYYPPFTWQYHQSQWEPPFDAEIGLMAIHSHHRMVKGTMNVAPANPPRPNDTDPICGGPKPDGTPATDLYTDWFWEDAPVCQYWKQQDGAVPLRKGESINTTCYVNNGITPEAIKHGLVAGASVQAIKAMGAPIPDYPAVGPASAWGDTLKDSPVGQELLYGTHPPINYRVVYKCSNVGPSVPGSTVLVAPEDAGNLYDICSPNPAVDADGDYLDGAYVNQDQCGGALCQPGSIVFACIGEDEMCIGVAMYWAMDRVLNPDGSVNQDGVNRASSGDVMNVGTPGNTNNPSDAGNCPECGPAMGGVLHQPGL